MIGVLFFIFLHVCLCCLFFLIVQRPLFCIYNKAISETPITPRLFAKISWHGLYTDIKAACYMTAVPVLMLWFHLHFPVFIVKHWLIGYEVIIAILIALLCVADTALYRFWQFKIEASVLHYLRSLKGTFASVSATYVVLAIVAVGVVAFILFAALASLVAAFDLDRMPMTPLAWWGHLMVAVSALLTASLFYVTIMGLHIRPDTPVYSYFSNIPFLNHCAVNPVYNFIYSLHISNDYEDLFQEYDPEWCRKKFEPLFPTTGIPRLQLLNLQRPNVLVIVWESLCANFMECMGGKAGVMPRFDELSREGVLFTNCWAGSFRTDRGLVCILSGYPGQPTTSVILHTTKLPHLPAMPRTLRDLAGYKTTAVHGGELNIFHKKDYYWASGHDRLIEEKDFTLDKDDTHWGARDDKVFSWLADDIISKAERGTRWYTTMQTLSSHEPFRVPYDRIKDNEVDNAFAYVDDAFGKFVDRLKVSPAWKDLLIVVTGDHGVNQNKKSSPDRNSHIPLLMLGGAIRQPMTIDTLMSQTDIASTLLGQLGLPHEDFMFSRDVLADTYTYPFALHTYNNAFIFRDHTGVTHYDNVSQLALAGGDAKREETAKVILQTLYSDLSKR